MKERPTLETDRLILRPFSLDDAPIVQELAGERDIADTTLNIPHPYEDGVAEAWIATHQESYERKGHLHFAIVLRSTDALIGAIGLTTNPEHESAEIGYWVGKPYWNCGYCTEAAKAVVAYGFDVLKLNRIYAHHFSRNPASGRVMQKIGMTHEGVMKQHIKKWGVFEDVEIYGLLRSRE
jgi:RimJ/RimL family protein N-acetyltransferase